jgi:hypothetical protein
MIIIMARQRGHQGQMRDGKGVDRLARGLTRSNGRSHPIVDRQLEQRPKTAEEILESLARFRRRISGVVPTVVGANDRPLPKPSGAVGTQARGSTRPLS